MNWRAHKDSLLCTWPGFERRKLQGYDYETSGGSALERSKTLCVEYKVHPGYVSNVRLCIYRWSRDNVIDEEPEHVLENPESLEQALAWGDLIMQAQGLKREYT